MIPLIYILLPDKNEQTYINVLTLLKNRMPNLNPRCIMIDFEKAFINAFKLVFPQSEVRGCLFHYNQVVWRKLQSLGMQGSYNSDVRFALNIRMLLALAFVPIHDVGNAFSKLVESQFFVDNEVELRRLLDYFERSWVGVLSRSGKKRLKPQYEISLWNCYNAVINDELRTNNAIEGWHNSFNNKVRVIHASICRFLKAIVNEQSITESLITQANTGLGIASKRRRQYSNINARLKNIVSSYDPNKQVQYLHDIAAILTL
ncbi:uncharacterized protein LOC130673861 [Microplitis mediator]|uniref:uncharacterized protein LOC130673861 n=1 Tax=Microplitis mediator TaxID=375433 RepID=UPI002553DD61|nr:uncharacterized protein LOC130673861 [Microplitis mediator]